MSEQHSLTIPELRIEPTTTSSYYPTNTTNKLSEDTLGKARANVDYQDKLWTQIDVLDDVKKMSETVVNRRIEDNSEKVRQLQEKILSKMEQIELDVTGDEELSSDVFKDVDAKMGQLEELLSKY